MYAFTTPFNYQALSYAEMDARGWTSCSRSNLHLAGWLLFHGGHYRQLGKPLGWSQGFLKEEGTVFSPNPESFGHSGIGGTLGWCDPKAQLAIGYVMNRSDWRVRSPRALALCKALYQCPLG